MSGMITMPGRSAAPDAGSGSLDRAHFFAGMPSTRPARYRAAPGHRQGVSEDHPVTRVDQLSDISLREAAGWASQQAKRLAANFGLDMTGDREMFALAQTAKLGEEVGELQAEVLGAIKYCRADKIAQFTEESLAGELADVMVCTMLLAEILDVDLARAVATKIGFLRERKF
jgi:NTP pyrophosphatase (non-canonical NTP hydrolase)